MSKFKAYIVAPLDLMTLYTSFGMHGRQQKCIHCKISYCGVNMYICCWATICVASTGITFADDNVCRPYHYHELHRGDGAVC